MSFLKLLHAVGMTNLTDEQVKKAVALGIDNSLMLVITTVIVFGPYILCFLMLLRGCSDFIR
jgi:hypothetical protein